VWTNRCQAGAEGIHGGELAELAGVAIGGGGLVYVAGFRNRGISTYAANGTWLRAFGKHVNRLLPGSFKLCVRREFCKPGEDGDGDGALRGPEWLAIDATGNVYVSEFGSRVSVFSAQATFLRAFGKDVVPGNAETGLEVCTTSCQLAVDGEGPGELNGRSGIATERGNVYVGEALNNRVSIFTTGGAFVQAFGRDVVPNNRETGFEACSAQCKVGAIGVGPGRFQIPLGITLDCRGALYVADRFNHRVQRLGAPGTASAPCAGPPAPSSPRPCGASTSAAASVCGRPSPTRRPAARRARRSATSSCARSWARKGRTAPVAPGGSRSIIGRAGPDSSAG